MTIFQIGDQFAPLKEQPFKLEIELQGLFEAHLEQITGLEFVASEFSIHNQCLDTLAFDHETRSFVIIEYKRSTNASVLDQGVSYLNTLLKYKADFILEYQERTGKLLSKKRVDWSQSKAVFVSPNFTPFQRQAVDFKDLNIELWEVKRFEHDLLFVSGVKKSAVAPSINTSKRSNENSLSLVNQELKTYLEEDHKAGKPDFILELYEEFKNFLFQMIPDLELIPRKLYLAFKRNRKNIVDIEIQQKQLKLFINAKVGELDDPRKIVRDVSQIGHWGNGDYQIIIQNDDNLEYIMSLIKQIL